MGGAIRWDELEPIFDENNSFSGNLASIYGNNIASFSQKMVLLTEDQYREALNITDDSEEGQDDTSRRLMGETETKFDELRSGGLIPTIYMALVDKYGTIVANDHDSSASVRVDISYNEKQPESLKYDPVVTGVS
mmetsp:Transcript_30377/g.22549  ORF Transcript_30377/g.22549 Transcript_30377/m.22549 type:complete len:135 (+) Transcript_30377:164-568(+)|eukprot:CAMPEP_0202979270 /NCGR_PEP_ID=MMETSP1396-20130829/85466_1 /ASSEMBLY_ACC=CAM_ASM_000872 /TAXON_ID= /ORGANISM="Pseudokeronopsis sp., Strain Brazil" /LENGTH=134 /DNA_ID=CAMNT_0049718619 /DNA_START=159 /DNA_END=563 /DNA_ORIENTATION=-